jgi:predicted transcriptional regulator
MITGNQLTAARNKLGLSLLATASMCLVSTGTILSAEQGKLDPESKAFSRIQNTLALHGADFSEV